MSAGPGASPLSSRRARLRDFWSLVYQKSTEDNIFFMAGAISYNLLIAVVPLFLLAVGLWGYVLRARYGEPSEAIVGLLENYIPAMGGDIDLLAEIESGINGLVASRAGYSIVGSILFIWLSTRLVSTLRIALREVFDIEGDRGVLRGKIFDLQVVVLGGVLLLLNVVITVVLQSAAGAPSYWAFRRTFSDRPSGRWPRCSRSRRPGRCSHSFICTFPHGGSVGARHGWLRRSWRYRTS